MEFLGGADRIHPCHDGTVEHDCRTLLASVLTGAFFDDNRIAVSVEFLVPLKSRKNIRGKMLATAFSVTDFDSFL